MEWAESYRFDKSKLVELHLDAAQHYRLLYDGEAKVLVLELIVTWIIWYSRYYWLDASDYRQFKADKPGFDCFVEEVRRGGPEAMRRNRLLCDEGPGGARMTYAAPEKVEIA